MMTDLKEIEEEYSLADDMEYILVDMEDHEVFHNKPMNKIYVYIRRIGKESDQNYEDTKED